MIKKEILNKICAQYNAMYYLAEGLIIIMVTHNLKTVAVSSLNAIKELLKAAVKDNGHILYKSKATSQLSDNVYAMECYVAKRENHGYDYNV